MQIQIKNFNFKTNLPIEAFKKEFFLEMREFYISSSKKIKDSFLIENDGLKAAFFRSNTIDQIIMGCFKNFASLSKTILNNFAVVATGGYGRQELAPFSDIDILFLHSIKNKKNLENSVKPFLHILWDLGLRVGYATRTPKECIYFSPQLDAILARPSP